MESTGKGTFSVKKMVRKRVKGLDLGAEPPHKKKKKLVAKAPPPPPPLAPAIINCRVSQ